MMMAKLSPGISSPAMAEMMGCSRPSIVWKANWISQNVIMSGRRSKAPLVSLRPKPRPTCRWMGAGGAVAVMGRPPGAGWGCPGF